MNKEKQYKKIMRLRPLLWSIVIIFPFSAIYAFESGGITQIIVLSGFFIYAYIVSLTLIAINICPWCKNPFFANGVAMVVSSHCSSCGMPEENNSRGNDELS